MRREIDLLKTRLEKDTQREIVFISLAELDPDRHLVFRAGGRATHNHYYT